MAGELLVVDVLAAEARHGRDEPLLIVPLASVKTKSLFIEIAEEMEWLNDYVGSLNSALQ